MNILKLLLLSICLPAFARPLPPSAPCPASGAPVHASGYLRVGGIPQWITIDGDDCRNPVVFMIHGGPGNANSPYSRTIYRPWEREFTIVQWDQRGAGMTFVKTPPADGETLTVERMRDDGLDAAAQVSRYLGTDKLVLFGSSWGSVLAAHMALARPEKFLAYVGTAQVINTRAPDAWNAARERLRADGNTKDLATLESLGSPPWVNPRSSGIMRRITRQIEKARTERAPAHWWQLAPDYATHEALFEAADEYSYLQFVGLNGDGMASTIDLTRESKEFKLPVYIVQGLEDLVTPTGQTRRWYDAISAPNKDMEVLERVGHDPNLPMRDAQYRMLKKAVQR